MCARFQRGRTQFSQAMPYCARRCMAPVRMCTSSGNSGSAPSGSTVVCRLCRCLLTAKVRHYIVWAIMSTVSPSGRPSSVWAMRHGMRREHPADCSRQHSANSAVSSPHTLQAWKRTCLVAVGLGRCDVVLHKAGDGSPHRVHLPGVNIRSVTIELGETGGLRTSGLLASLWDALGNNESS